MKRKLWARIDKPLKLGLLILLFSFVSIIGSVGTGYAMSSKLLVSPPIQPTPIHILPFPQPTPTPTSTPIPTPAATQPPPQAIPTPQVTPVPTTAVLPDYPVIAISPTVVPTATSVSITPTVVATPSTAKSILPVPTTLHLQNAADQSFDALMVSLMLGIGAPLLLVSGGALWLLLRWKIKRRGLALQQGLVQASPSIHSYGMQPPLYAQQSTGDTLSNLMPFAQVAGGSGASPMAALSVQPTYTPSNLRPITTAFPQQMFAVHSNEAAGHPLNGDLRPFQIGSLDLSLGVPRAIEANGNGQMPLVLASPSTLVDTPTSSMPSSPPVLLAAAVVIQ